VILWQRQEGVGVAAENVAGLAPGLHGFHVHSGSCASLGPLRTPLAGMWVPDDVISPDEGVGLNHGYEDLAEAIELAWLQDGNHYLDIHTEGAGGVVVSCVDIPAAAPVDGTATAQQTPFIRVAVNEVAGSGVSGDLVLLDGR
jgi:hypothetical protein